MILRVDTICIFDMKHHHKTSYFGIAVQRGNIKSTVRVTKSSAQKKEKEHGRRVVIRLLSLHSQT